MMRYSVSFFFLVILFLAVVDADILNETCQKAAQDDKNLHYDFCVAALGEDPKSHSADLQGLGIISLELIKDNATKIGSRIGELLNDGKISPDVKERLKDCQDLYSDVKSDVNDAIDAFKSKDYIKANLEVSSASDASTTCEDGFTEKPGLKSPLSIENDNFFQLSVIALSITKFLHETSLV
ncbi:putative invertase inhibitor [Telopea speciosissima]|uniref:putative invertase inhibitor n=1 Tax=Telopea speciosissima TaxID=54955 RepID=UPI001CC34821|nr:putative invertase inhibitor [Telopea speciosissima]